MLFDKIMLPAVSVVGCKLLRPAAHVICQYIGLVTGLCFGAAAIFDFYK